MKNIQNVDAYKKGYIDFCHQMPPPLKTVVSFHKCVFRSFLQKYCFFRKTSFIIKHELPNSGLKKVISIFLPKKLLFPKKWSNGPPEQFFAVFSEKII